MAKNPLDGFRVDAADIAYIGSDLQRPECILAERDGTLWSADARGGVMRIAPDGAQQLITSAELSDFSAAGDEESRFTEGTLPNGLAFAANGDILIANYGTDLLERMTRSGQTGTLHDNIDGKPMGKVNFVLRDSRDRLWLTISTRAEIWMRAFTPDVDDGYVALVERGTIRIVADGFTFTNEVRLDAREEFLYVVETTGKRISRLRVEEDGELREREIFGPSNLGKGFPDGIAFDSFGNLWGTLIMSDQLFALTPEGECRILLDDGNAEATDALETAFYERRITPELMLAASGKIAPWMASVTFGGADLKTVYLGSLRGTRIPYFRSPVAGLAMVHW
ncbi:MAG: SMP-30/gluconolactonase/LRE family protein [Alphaproteobacteria bacterium]|nr:SMP-30/gluconolactonase/LRE family protein [Alphaproteobacteria bacterium]